jgi:cytochrome c biogenesis protein
MSTLENTLNEISPDSKKATKKAAKPIVNQTLDFLSSVRFGVSMLIILVVLSMIGMLIVQQNVGGFDSFYASLTPAEKTVYAYLGFFDIYYSWYFKFLLLVLSLNIILASIDHFPAAWKYFSNPKTETTKAWLKHQKESAVIEHSISTEKVVEIFKKQGLRTKVTEKNGRVHVFGQSGVLNRLGAYIVHVFLLTLFIGHFVALQTGFDADVRFEPGQTTNEIQLIKFNLDNLKNPDTDIQERYAVQLPFSIACTDIQQKLIDPKGSIEINNTLDWRTQIKINDPSYGEQISDVSLNKPVDYRGYRFFQASAITEGKARQMKIEILPTDGLQPISFDLMRNGTTDLPDGTKIEYENFWSDFAVGQQQSTSNNFENAAVKMKITKDGETKSGYAFAKKLPDGIPINAPVFGNKFKLAEFEKVPMAHVLSIKYDPFQASFIAWYIGGFGLMGALVFVFFISHRRVWALIDDKETIIGGNTNRNHQGFEESFNKIRHNLSIV